MPNQLGSEAKVLMTFAFDEFKEVFGEKPYYTQAEFAISMRILKNLLSNYSKKQIKKFIKDFYQLNDPFLKDAGYKIRFLPSKINSLMVKKNGSSEPNKDYNKSNYKSSISDEQLFEYMSGKRKEEFTGEEPWAKAYETEIARRGLTRKDLKEYLNEKC